MTPPHFLLACFAGWMNRRQQLVIEYLQEEVRVLREQLGRRPHFSDDQRRRLAAKGKPIGRKGLARFASIVTPDTLLAWHRRLIARKYDSSAKRKAGRPATKVEIRELVLQKARENWSWGCTRIQGALANLRHEVGRGTIAKLLREAGLDPAPDRRKGTTWKEFLRMHWSTMAATDFFTVEVWTPRGLVRHHVLFVIRLMTREIQFTGIVPEPDQAWMKQIARNITDGCDGFLCGVRFLIHDRPTLFCEQFREIVKGAGVEPLRLPARSPNLNAYAERLVRSVKESCVEQMLFFGQASLRRALAEFESHYHIERNHQGIENKIIRPEFPELPESGRVAVGRNWVVSCDITIEKRHDSRRSSFRTVRPPPRRTSSHW